MADDKIVAYLIIAHDQPEHFCDLIAQLQHDEVSFFVHIDKKADITPFRAAVSQYDNVSFVEERMLSGWGTFALVRATLGLLGAATESPHGFKYCVLLSGACYPTQSSEHILSFFQNSEQDFISYRPEVSSLQYHKYRAVFGWLMDFVYNLRLTRWIHRRGHTAQTDQQQTAPPTAQSLSVPAPAPRRRARRSWNVPAALVKKALGAREYYHDLITHHVDRTSWYFFKYNLVGNSPSRVRVTALGIAEFFLNLILPTKKPPARLRPHVGRQWWSLRYDTATELYRFLTDKKNRDILNFYRYSSCSDERIFHSVIASGLLDARPAPEPHYTHHQRMLDGRPLTLTLADLPAIQQSDALFARKFDYVKSAELKRELLKSIGSS